MLNLIFLSIPPFILDGVLPNLARIVRPRPCPPTALLPTIQLPPTVSAGPIRPSNQAFLPEGAARRKRDGVRRVRPQVARLDPRQAATLGCLQMTTLVRPQMTTLVRLSLVRLPLARLQGKDLSELLLCSPTLNINVTPLSRHGQP